jgi:hypothetical protein
MSVRERERGLVIKKGDTILENVVKGFTGFLVKIRKTYRVWRNIEKQNKYDTTH